MKQLVSAALLVAACAGPLFAQHFDMKQWGENRGYTDAPYFRYEADANYCVTTGEQLEQTDDQRRVWSEASNQQAVKLTSTDQYVRWTNDTGTADAVTVRYSLPSGSTATIGVFVDGQEIGRADVNTDHFWEWNSNIQGFRDNKPEYYSVHERGSRTWARMRFNDVMFRLSREITQGQQFEIRLISGAEATIDFVEIEKATYLSPADAQAQGMAVFSGSADLQNFIYQNQQKTIYVPEGTYTMNQIRIPDGTNLQGAGMFYTLFVVNRGMDSFSSSFVRDIHFMCTINQRYPWTGDKMGDDVKCFNGNGGGHDMLIERVCMENFTCGAWFDNYRGATFRHCRVRNNYADGINFCNGSSNGTIEQCNFRNNGDDDVASWTYQGQSTGHKIYNVTCEHNWRASSLGWFGGGNHAVKNMLIKDGMEIGIRMVSDFPGNGYIGTNTFENIAIVHQGSINGDPGRSGDFWGVDEGALHFEATETYDIPNMQFKNVDIYDSRGNAVFVGGRKWAVKDLLFDEVRVHGVRDTGSYAYYFERADGNATFRNCKASGIEPRQLTNFASNYTLTTGQSSWADQGKNFSLKVEGDVYDPGVTAPYGAKLGITALSWNPVDGNPGDDLEAGTLADIKVLVVNNSNVTISENVPVIVRVMIDGKQVAMTSVLENWNAGEAKIVTLPWSATGGYHTMVAELDPYNVLKDAVEPDAKSRTKRFNVSGDAWSYTLAEDASNPEIQILDLLWKNVTSGDSDWGHSPVKAGDRLIWAAKIHNGTGKALRGKIGVQYRYNGKNYEVGVPTWCDNISTMAVDETRLFETTGGKQGKEMNINSDFKTLSVVCNDDPASNPSYKKTIIRNFDFVLPYTGQTQTGEADEPDDLNTTPVDPDETFDIEIQKLGWTPGTPEIEAGSEIRDFKVLIKNIGNIAMEARTINVRVSLDGKTVGSAASELALAPGSDAVISIDGSAVAAGGAHKVKATVARIEGEYSSSNNSRELTFNAIVNETSPIEPSHEYVNPNADSSNLPFVIQKVEWYKDGGTVADPIVAGDKVRFRAYVKNVSANNDPAIKHGIQYQIPVGVNASLWCDTWTTSTQPGDVMELVSNGGNAGPGVWTAENGTRDVMAWFNDTHDLGSWQCQVTFPVKIGAEMPEIPEYFDNPTGADSDIVSGINTPAIERTGINVWYSIDGRRFDRRPAQAGIYIHNGKKIIIR